MECKHSDVLLPSRKLTIWLVPLCFWLALTGCDGGSGNDPGPGTPSLQSRTLSFADHATAKLLVDERYANPAMAVGGGQISYESDDSDIAQVDHQGQVTALNTGQVTIRARIAANGVYAAASASYQVVVAPANIGFTAWVGSDNTEIQLPEELAGIDFYTSSQADCDYDNYSVCEAADLAPNLVQGARLTDAGATTLNHPGYYQVRFGKYRANGAISLDRFSARAWHQAVYFNDRFWVIGGSDGASSNEVWSSIDGQNWVQMAPPDAASSLPDLEGHQLVVFDAKDGAGERLWVLGGYGEAGVNSDVWASTDGRHWQPVEQSSAFPERFYHQAVVFADRLWVIGGYNSALLNDIWVSDDGADWQPMAASPLRFNARRGHQLVVFDERLWLIDGSQHLGDVWMSADGETWTDVTQATQAEFPGRAFHQAVVFNNRLWLFGGIAADDRGLSDAWSMGKTSAGGYQWQAETDGLNLADIAPNGMANFQVLAARERLWLIGGYHVPSLGNEVWSSVDGKSWRPVASNTEFRPRQQHQVVVFDDDPNDETPARLWLIGGQTSLFGFQPSDEIWSSRDGISWTLEPAGERFSARFGHRLVVFDDRLWLAGGQDGAEFLDDVWSSTDGLSWVKETDLTSLTFDQRQILSDEFNDGGLLDVSDDASWQQRSVTPPYDFSSRNVQPILVYDDGHGEAMWLVGGNQDQMKGAHNNVWRTTDGNQWRRAVKGSFTLIQP